MSWRWTSINAACFLMVGGAASGQCPQWLPFDTTPPDMRFGATALTTWDPDGGGPLDGGLLAGGQGVNSENIVTVWDGSAWQSLGGWDAAYDEVNDFAVFGGELFGAAGYNTTGGTPLDTIRRWDGAEWQGVGGGLDATWGYAYAYAATVFDGELIVGGYFDRAGGNVAHRIARWDGSSWRSLGAGINNHNVSGFVNTLAVYNGELIAAGAFQRAGGSLIEQIARWDGDDWRSLGTGITGGQREVFELIEYDGDLIAVGAFFEAGGVASRGIARWDGNSWSGVGGAGVFGGNNGAVYSVAVHDGDLIIGGSFAEVGGVPASNIARWDGSQWHAMDDGRRQHVWEMRQFDDDLHVVSSGWDLWGCEDCAADLDGDGDIDAEDFFAYLDLFASGDDGADIDGDGDIDAEDFFGYLDLFAAGC